MQPISPDMDDLFRKASENYPLKQGRDRWEEIASKLDKNSQPPEKSNKRGYKRYLAILLFLFAFLFLADIFTPVTRNKEIINENSRANKAGGDLEQTVTSNKEKPELTGNNSSPQILHASGPGQSTIFQPQTTDQTGNTTVNLQAATEKSYLIQTGTRNDDPIEAIRRSGIEPPNILAKEKNEIGLISVTAHQEKPNKNKRLGFYFGLTTGAGITSIRSQQVNKIGFEIGVIGGYRVNDRFSAEAGWLFSNKYYQTSGEYFSLKTVGGSMPAGMQIMEVESSTHFFQAPLHIRYDLLDKKIHRLFGAAGISSYIVMKESNSYHMMMNGSGSMMYSTYKNRPVYFAGSFDLSIGYEKDIGTRSHIRIEPYLQLPLKGIGVGELQLKSAGLHIALTRSARL